MAFARRLLILVATALCCAFGGFAVGGRMGFSEGYMVSARTKEILAASGIAAVLRSHDQGKCEDGRGILELMVDTALITEWGYSRVPHERPFYAPRKAYEIDLTCSLRFLANYRQSHSDRTQEGIRDMVLETVARYADPSPNCRSERSISADEADRKR